MRDIKFRVWNKDSNKWATQINLASANGGSSVLDGKEGWTTNLWTVNDKNRYVIEQYVTIKDKNNKDIYEGDIVRSSAEQMSANNTPIQYLRDYVGVVIWSDLGFGIKSDSPMHWRGLEIIGNIHEDPSLVKQHG